MKTIKRFTLIIALLCPVLLFGQAQPPSAYQPQLITYGGTPFGPCQTYQFAQNVTTGSYYNCVNGAWSLVAGANNPAPQYGAAYYLGPGTTNILAGTSPGLTGQALAFTNGSPPSPQSPGIPASINSPVSSSPYTFACDSVTAIVDRAHTVHFATSSATITVPLSTATGCGGGLITTAYDDSPTLTVNATSPDVFTIYGISAVPLTNQTTFSLYKGQSATFDQDVTGTWSIRKFGPPFDLISTSTNCAANGTAANPSVVSCSAAAAGMFSCATNASTGTCQVNTTAVTANSEIFVTQDAADGGVGQLNVTCNTTNVLNTSKPLLVSKSAGTSFTINLGTVSSNPACFEFHIVN